MRTEVNRHSEHARKGVRMAMCHSPEGPPQMYERRDGPVSDGRSGVRIACSERKCPRAPGVQFNGNFEFETQNWAQNSAKVWATFSTGASPEV